MKTYEVKVTYVGYYETEAENESEALGMAKDFFGDTTGSWSMAKSATYEISDEREDA